ncbi:MAG: transketolase [Actinomycetota bacterium]
MPLDVAALRGLERRCVETRLRVLEQVEVAGGGHYGSSLSLVEILVSLYDRYLRVRPQDPDWLDRDRLILSKGHGCSALYAVLADLGFMERAELATFTRLGSRLGDHPDRTKVPGVDFSSGSLGHGLSVGAGMALGARHRGTDGRVVVVVGDGEQNEGQIWEAANYAGARGLSNLLVVCDRNGVQVDGTTKEILDMEPMDAKWRAFGWNVLEVDGHDLAALVATWEAVLAEQAMPGARPTIVIARTQAGKGIPQIEGNAAWHVGYLHGPDLDAAVRSIRGMYPEAAGGAS